MDSCKNYRRWKSENDILELDDTSPRHHHKGCSRSTSDLQPTCGDKTSNERLFLSALYTTYRDVCQLGISRKYGNYHAYVPPGLQNENVDTIRYAGQMGKKLRCHIVLPTTVFAAFRLNDSVPVRQGCVNDVIPT